MSEATTRLQDIMAALPAASDASGKSVVLTDANGAMVKYSSVRIMKKIELAKQDLDANNLTSDMTIYTPVSDMNTWTGYEFKNFPKKKPDGGFSLTVIREAGYFRQIYRDYASNNEYVRRETYGGVQAGRHWNNWEIFRPTSI